MSSSTPPISEAARAEPAQQHTPALVSRPTPVFKCAPVVRNVGNAKRRKVCGVVLFLALAIVGGIVSMQAKQRVPVQDLRVPLQYWTIEAKERGASAPIRSEPTGNAETSLTAYFARPLVELPSVKFGYGESMVHKGANPQAPGEEVFELRTPVINIPGFVKIQPVAICAVRYTGKSYEVTGQRLEVLGAGEAALKDAKIDLFGEMGWIDTPSRREVSFKVRAEMGLVPNSAAKAIMPQFLFEKVGSAAMGLSMDLMVKDFAHAFVEDYERWVKAKSKP